MPSRNPCLWAAVLAILPVAGCSLLVTETNFEADSDGGRGDAGLMDGGLTDGAVPDAAPTDASLDASSDAGPPCGNATEDIGEACDDGNTTPSDGCSATCTIEVGFTCTGFGASSCAPICGDGMTVGDEVCDDGFTTACGACNDDCTAVGTAVLCGDAARCRDTEACDDANTEDGDGCSAGCTMIETGYVCVGLICAMTCSNGVLDPGEECDDGRNDDGDGCSAACERETGWACTGTPSTCDTVCGDGIIVVGEETCDDMNTADDDGCSAACGEEAGWTCMGSTSTCTETCGDGMVVGDEVCDDGNSMTEVECPYGTATCMNFCNAGCSMVLNLTGGVCGDGTRDVADGEACDDRNTNNCGLCNTGCTSARTYAAATGLIVVVARDTGADGQTFTLNDGAGVTVTYAIETGSHAGCPAGPIVCIVISAAITTADAVALTVAEVINMGTAIGINASAAGATVTLSNDSLGGAGNGANGNQAITGAVTGWTFSGMENGVARNCNAGVGCTSNNDCRSGICSSGSCT